jgi:uncharacterized delta-60 repeat protein
MEAHLATQRVRTPSCSLFWARRSPRRLIFGAITGLALSLATTVPGQTILTSDLDGNRAIQAAATGTVAPVIVGQPMTQLGQVGGNYSFSVVASGTGPLTYQWYENGAAISGATTDTLAITNAQAANFTNHSTGANSYDVKVTNSATTVTSTTVALYLDTDGEGLPDWWQIQYFGAIGVAPGADPDGDGVTNLQEYEDGTNPTSATSQDFTLTVNGPVIVTPEMQRYPAGTSVTLSVPGSRGAYFQNWSGDASGTANPLTVVIDADENITAVTSPAIVPAAAPFLSSSGDGAVVSSVLVQGNGQILVGGLFSTLNGRPQWDLGRLNTNGTLDTTFFPGAGNGLPVASFGVNPLVGAVGMVQQTNGQVVVVGFSTGKNAPAPSIYRVNTNGTLDTTFLASAPTFIETSQGYQANTTAVALQSDGKILIAGNFATVGGVARAGIARLNTDGSLDTTFNPGTGFVQQANNNYGTLVSADCLQIAANGQIYVAGSFGTYNGVSTPGVARLNATGTLDTTFNVGTGAGVTPGENTSFTCMLIRPAGGILLGTQESGTTFNGAYEPALFALTSTGAIDTTFNSANAVYSTQCLALQSNGQILVGSFYGVMRINANGSADSTFNANVSSGDGVISLAVQSNGQIIAVGNFNTAGSTTQLNIVRLNTNGSLDTTAVMNAGSAGAVDCLAEQSDGKVLVGGSFLLLANTPATNLGRLNADSSVDTTFNVGGSGPDESVTAVFETPADKIFVAGGFSNYNGTTADGYVRLNLDGTIDSTFTPGSQYGPVTAAVQQSDGKIVLAGNFQTYAVSLERLNTDGTVDSTYSPYFDQAAGNQVFSLALQPDGKLLIGGQFQTVDGTSSPYLARLNSDGSLDTTFNAPSVAAPVTNIALEPNGQILYAAEASVSYPQRLNTDGSADPTYASIFDDVENYGTIRTLITLPDGSAMIGGLFTYGYSTTKYFYKLTPDGEIDPTFNPDFNYYPTAILARSNGEVYFGGGFNTDGAADAVGLVRVSASPDLLLGTVNVSAASPVTTGTAETLTASASSVPGEITSLYFQASTDNINFTDIAQGTNSSGTQWTAQWTPATTGTYYLRTFAIDNLFDMGVSVAISDFTVSEGSAAPQITAQPQNQVATLGGSANFSVTATGTGLSYQWKFNGTALANQTAATLSLANVTQAQGGSYSVVVSNSAGSVTSSAATLTVQGSYTQWEAIYGFSGSPSATPEGDSVPNLLKYVFDIDPARSMTPGDRAALPTVGETSNGEDLTLTFRQNSLLTGTTVAVQTSVDLQTWTTLTDPTIDVLSVDPANNDETLQVQVPVDTSTSKQFIRLRVSSP